MAQITEAITLTGACIEEITLQPTDKEPKAVLVLSGPLPADLARQLDCREMVFDANDVPRPFEGPVGLTHLMKDRIVETELTGPLYADLVYKFRVTHKSETELTVSVRLHFTGRQALDTLLPFFAVTNKATFDLRIMPLQGSLFEQDNEEEHETP